MRTAALSVGVLAMGVLLGAVAGCGSATRARAGNRSTAAQRIEAVPAGCGLDERVMASARTVEVPGTRVSLALPRSEEMMLMRGLPIVVHECGLAVAVISAPVDGTGRLFLDGALQGTQQELEARGFTCQVGRSGAAWRCVTADGLVAFVRRIGPQDGGALVSVEGASEDEPGLQRIAGSATYDPGAVFDPLQQRSIALAVPEGMRPAFESAMIHYVAPEVAGAFVADVRWEYVAYAEIDAHQDGSEWTDREMGQVAGRLASEGIDGIEMGSIRQIGGGEDGAFVEITADATMGGQPLALYVRAERDAAGVFVEIARVARAEIATWLPRLRAHGDSLRALE